MTWVDYVIIGVIVLSALIGLARGFIREVLSLAVWLGAVFIAWVYFGELSVHLAPWISTPSVRLGAAFLILVFAVLIVGAIIGHLLTYLVEKTGLTGTDRVLGVVFGGARGAVLVAMLVFLGALTPLPEDSWWEESMLIGRFQVLAERILGEIPPDIVEKLKQI
ncbi:MAG: CvpA family protein [Pseudomonadota bacterium]|nr:CvpA family protein [Pseudomonadota bacterium]